MIFIARYLNPLLAFVGAVALAMAAYTAVDAFAEHGRLAAELERQRTLQAERELYAGRFQEWQEYVLETQEFVTAAEASGLRPEDWNRYEVDLQRRLVELRELDSLLEQARAGSGYYFRPREFELAAVNDADDLRDANLPDGGRARDIRFEPGRYGILTLRGEYLVTRRQ